MVVWNTNEDRQLEADYDGVRRFFPAGWKGEVPDAMGRGVLYFLEAQGLVQLPYGKPEKEMWLKAKKAQLLTVEQILRDEQSALQNAAMKGYQALRADDFIQKHLDERRRLQAEIAEGEKSLFGSAQGEIEKIAAELGSKQPELSVPMTPPPAVEAADLKGLDAYMDEKDMPAPLLKTLYAQLMEKVRSMDPLTKSERERKKVIEAAAKSRGIILSSI